MWRLRSFCSLSAVNGAQLWNISSVDRFKWESTWSTGEYHYWFIHIPVIFTRLRVIMAKVTSSLVVEHIIMLARNCSFVRFPSERMLCKNLNVYNTLHLNYSQFERVTCLVWKHFNCLFSYLLCFRTNTLYTHGVFSQINWTVDDDAL